MRVPSIAAALLALGLSGGAWASDRPPIVIIPGAPGSELIESGSGRTVWPSAKLMTTRDGNTILALPLDDPESSPIVVGGLLRSVKVAGMKFPVHVYKGLEKHLRELGYREGDWSRPKGEGEYYFFPYDWRQSVETSGRRFARELSAFHRRCPADTPPVVVLGHSLGGLLARYALMYGDAPLGSEGPLPPVTWAGQATIASVFLVATPNEGTFIALKRLEEGIFYKWHRGAFSPEMLFSYPSVFDMIPSRLAPLVDHRGTALPYNLDDPEAWKTVGWSILDPRSDSTIPYEVRREHLKRELARHDRLWAAMQQLAATPNPVPLTVVAGWGQTVQRSAWVTDGKDGMTVRFDPPPVARARLKPFLFEPGDAMVPMRSLLAENSPHDPASSTYFARVLRSKKNHHALLSSPELLNALNEALK